MQASKPIVWLPGAVLSQYLRFICPEGFETANPDRWRTLGMGAYWAVYISAMVWLKLVTDIVPVPYLDEIFHIPQAQLYCAGRYDYWDPKLTTPPGLYVFATLFTKLRYGEWDIFGLRLFNATTLPITMLFALSCRHLITTPRGTISPNSIHTALNIALFPPLFFFSGLFYTDLLSTCVVLVTYRLFLRSRSSTPWMIYPAGLVALTMRQTNIFWVAIFLAGLEVVKVVSVSLVDHNGDQPPPGPWKERVKYEFQRWGNGNIHDIPVSAAGVHDYVLCAISVAVAILHRPMRVLTKLTPYVALIISFGGFVFWNGGVVLGDKSNHVATVHLPQLLYLFAFTAFFSLPLIIGPILAFLWGLLELLRLPLFPRLKWQYLLAGTYCVGALIATLLTIRYNTVIHPFTLADNRHYVFYVFRYTILRHPLIRFLLAPIYLVCGWAVYLTLCGPSSKPRSHELIQKSTSTSKSSPKPTQGIQGSILMPTEEYEPNTSFLLIFILTTALSLITAPLVEPRYFIIPWVIWRLHVPTLSTQEIPPSSVLWSPRSQAGKPRINTNKTRSGTTDQRDHRSYDYRLWMETVYFLSINVVTGYVFLYRGFEWPQEPGNVQRFMW